MNKDFPRIITFLRKERGLSQKQVAGDMGISHSIILPGISIGDNCVIGAGSVVSSSIPSNSVAVGNPARVVSSYEEFVEKHRRQMKSCPVFPTVWSEKSEEEKAEMKAKLEKSIGYDK